MSVHHEQEEGMSTYASRTLAVELHAHSPTHWIATYYPMVRTPMGRGADITWVLHRCLMPATSPPGEPARWLEACSYDPHHPCYAGHQVGVTSLAAGYTAALAALRTETADVPLPLQDTRGLGADTVVVPLGQLPEWVLDDLEDENPDSHG